jgi:hypothetical protein
MRPTVKKTITPQTRTIGTQTITKSYTDDHNCMCSIVLNDTRYFMQTINPIHPAATEKCDHCKTAICDKCKRIIDKRIIFHQQTICWKCKNKLCLQTFAAIPLDPRGQPGVICNKCRNVLPDTLLHTPWPAWISHDCSP